MATTDKATRAFQLGQVLPSMNASAAFVRVGAAESANVLIAHALCDWGEVSAETERANLRALTAGHGVVVSSRELSDGTSIVITTVEDWSVTRIETHEDGFEAAMDRFA